MRSTFVRLTDRAPALARILRDLRDARARRRFVLHHSTYGFSLWGGNYLASGLHEPEEMAIMADALTTADLFVDCGANGGLYTCLAAALGVPVIAIEPDQQNLRVLYRNLRANAFTVPIEVRPVAVGAAPCLATLYGRGQGASLIAGWGGQSAVDARTVPMLPLDAILGRRFDGQRIVLKIDVEGSEWGVLAGATQTLAQRPRILLELGRDGARHGAAPSDARQVRDRLTTAGYRLHHAARDNIWCVPDGAEPDHASTAL